MRQPKAWVSQSLGRGLVSGVQGTWEGRKVSCVYKVTAGKFHKRSCRRVVGTAEPTGLGRGPEPGSEVLRHLPQKKWRAEQSLCKLALENTLKQPPRD